MEIKVLSNFLTVAAEGSISKAADILHISQPALSRQIMDLENELGIRLFVRRSHSIELTLDGLRFQERAQTIVDLAEKTVDEFQNQKNELTGEITIACDEAALPHTLADMILVFSEEFPKVKFAFINAIREAALHYLNEGTADLALLHKPVNDDLYHYVPVNTCDRLGILMSRSNEYASRSGIGEKDLLKMNLLVFHSFINPHYPKVLDISRSKLSIIGNYTSVNNVIPLIQDGCVNALCWQRKDALLPPGLTFIPLEKPIDREIVLAYRRRHTLSPSAEQFVIMLRDVTEE